jgi:GNAT superfamily N-acetyltransferase
MRAVEFITESKTVEYEGLTLKISKNGHELTVDALDDWGNKVLGHVKFNIGDGKELDPQDLRVDDKYQGQGIARVMYDYVKSLGYTINRSWDQTDAGAGFWNKHRGEDVRVWEQGVAEGSLNEGLSHPVIVVDVQPEYSGMNDGDESAVFPQIINFVNKQTGPVLMFVNAEDQGLSGDTVAAIQTYWEDTIDPDWYDNDPDTNPINWSRFQIVDKGYGYFRGWMDAGIEPSTIIATIRELYQQHKNDSRELQFPPFNKRTTQQSLIQGAMEELNDEPLSVNWTSVAQLKRFNGAYLVGGARDQCLREVELLMNAFNIKYKRIDSLIYEGQQGVAEGKQPGQPVVDAILKVMPIAQEIWFHGSRATGKHRKNSDTDILVVVPDDLVGDQYLGVVRILQKLSRHFDNYDIQPTHPGYNIHLIAQEEGRLIWSNKQDVAEDQVHEADASTVQFQTASTDNYQSSFTVTAIADGKNVGHFSFFRDPETDDVHNQAEVTDDVRGKGYGKALLLKAIEVANDHGLGFQEDSQSLSRAQSRVYDSLYDAGWIVDADGYWFLTPEGEQELARLSTIQQGVAENFAEARSNPEQNIKPESGMKELMAVAETIADPENWAVSMTSEPKLGINPQVGISEDTPKGIYFYPLDYAVGMIQSRKPLPWGDNLPYIQLFQYDRSGEMTKETSVDPARLKQALLQYCPEEVIDQAFDEPEYDGTPYWFIYDCLSRLGKSDETNIVRWNKVLRDLGFTSVFDDGAGWIAHNEPTQGVVLDPRIIKQLKTIVNKQRSRVVTPAVIEQAIFEAMDMELAANRAWQKYDPDGTKLKAAAKEYAKDPRFKPWLGKPGSEELFDKASGWGRYNARQLSDEAWAWYKAQQAQQPASQESIEENFADGKNPGRKGLSKRVGIPKKATLGKLEKIARSSTGERRRMAQWQLNMRRGKKK